MEAEKVTKSRLIQINPDYYEHFRDVLVDLRIAIVNAELKFQEGKRHERSIPD